MTTTTEQVIFETILLHTSGACDDDCPECMKELGIPDICPGCGLRIYRSKGHNGWTSVTKDGQRHTNRVCERSRT